MATIDLGKIKQVFRGTYNNATAYVPDDLVVFTDTGITSTYICTTASTGNNPSSGGTAHANWAYLAKGVADPIPSQSGQSGKFLTTNGSALSFAEAGAGKLLKIHDAVTTTSTLVTTPSRGDTTLAITFTPQALGSTFYITAFQFGRNGVSGDSSFHRFFLMREIAGGTASELQSYIYLGSTDHTKDYDIFPLTYKDSPTYTAGQTINYHIEVGFYTGNYSLNFRAQEGSHPSRIFVYEMGT